MADKIIDAELVDEDPRPKPRPQVRAAKPDAPDAPLHIEVHAWPEQLRGRAVITERGQRREFNIDGSALALVLGYLKRFR
jgi:hypothetical protein